MMDGVLDTFNHHVRIHRYPTWNIALRRMFGNRLMAFVMGAVNDSQGIFCSIDYREVFIG